ECFSGALNVFFIDLPFVLANSTSYISCTSGPDSIGLVTAATAGPLVKPFVLVPNHLLPAYEDHLPEFHLVHNAISFNEMSAAQLSYYFDFVERHLAADGVFHIAGGTKHLDYHLDVVAAAKARFSTYDCYADSHIHGHLVGERPNLFIRRSSSA